MPDPRETLARIRAQADAATDRPWRAAVMATYVDADGRRRGKGGIYPGGEQGPPPLFLTMDWLETDAEFIAASRTTVPRLVAALDAVLELHVRAECPTCGSRDGEGNEFHKCDDDAYCEECDLEGYPCPTVEAITQALSTA